MTTKTAQQQPKSKEIDARARTASVGRKVADQERFYVLELELSEWLSGFADHPRHRDVKRHSKKAHWEFARRAEGPMQATLCSVSAADLNGHLFKLEGHTRSYLWCTNRLNPPDTVIATVYRCRTEAELHALYTMFHSQFPVEERYESVLAAYRAHHLSLKSARLRDGMVVDALYIAVTGVARSNQKTGDAGNELDMFKAVGYFRDELQLLDTVNPRGEVFHGGVVAAALLGLAVRPGAITFFEELAKDGRRGGFETEPAESGKRDPVAALLRWLWELKQSKSAWVKRSQEDLCARTLHALFKFLQGPKSMDYWFDDVPAPEDITPIIQTVRHLKGIVELGV